MGGPLFAFRGYVDSCLAQARPARSLALSLEHDPVDNKLLQPSSTSAPSTEGGLLPLLTSLVSVREGGQGTAVSCVQEKTDQLQNLLDLLKAAECRKETKEARGQGRKELETLLGAP